MRQLISIGGLLYELRPHDGPIRIHGADHAAYVRHRRRWIQFDRLIPEPARLAAVAGAVSLAAEHVASVGRFAVPLVGLVD